jgi:tetratricopeptide (TPR) repeat protein
VSRAHRTATLVAAVALALAMAARAQTRAPEEVFAAGNAAYESGDFDAAVAEYLRLVAQGAVHRDLYYNLGNAYYRGGDLGRAVLYYERALRLSPRDDDVRANLSVVRSLLRDREFQQRGGWVARTLLWIPRQLSTGELFALTSVLYLIFCAVALAFVLRHTRLVSQLYARLSMLSPGRLLGLSKAQDFALAMALVGVVCAATAYAALGKDRTEVARRHAVVVDEEVAVYSGPNREATLQFKIHEGTIVRADETRGGWVEIALPGELSGWVPVETLERI